MNADHRYIKGTPKGPQESGLLEFTKSACLTIDAFTDDAEVAADSYRAHWTDLGQGIVQIEKIERNDARHGYPTGKAMASEIAKVAEPATPDYPPQKKPRKAKGSA